MGTAGGSPFHLAAGVSDVPAHWLIRQSTLLRLAFHSQRGWIQPQSLPPRVADSLLSVGDPLSEIWLALGNATFGIMKTRISKLVRFLSLLSLAGWPAVAQTPGPIIIAREGTQFTLSWDCVSGRRYQLYSTTSLGNSWQEVATQPTPLVASGNRLSYSLSLGPEVQFYCVAELAESTPVGMVWIPPGGFTMGDTFNEGDGDELPTHPVEVSAFYMDQYEVTKALWDEVMTWAVAHGYRFDNAGLGKAANHPVQSVNWCDAVKWCNARSEKEGRVPAYYTDAAQITVYRTGQVEVANGWVKWDTGYRLPTEAEWEKAARGGASGHRFPWSNVDTITHSQASYYSTNTFSYDISPTHGTHPSYRSGGYPYTSPVGSFAANGHELYDMAGNVYEWCWDWWGSYSAVSETDPRGPTSGSSRVFRGGGWRAVAFRCRAANRNRGIWPGNVSLDIGFRPVLPSGQP
jgi:formylglycine-generating enzyme